METAVSPSCGKMARVIVQVQIPNVQGGVRVYEVLRCWKHYLKLENDGRGSSTMKILSAKMIKE